MQKNINLNLQAIQAAISGNWQKAIDINSQILKTSSQNIEAVLRLAKAYEELGKPILAKKMYKKSIKIDKFNSIAKRALVRMKEKKCVKNKDTGYKKMLNEDLFLEEPGKTKSVSLIRLASPKILLSLNTAEPLSLCMGSRIISIRDRQKRYLGRLPDDLSQRLIKLIKRGNKYQAIVKELDKKKLIIFIKECKKSKKNKDLNSFPCKGDQYHTFLLRDIIDNEK